jgi:type VI secretion system protein ImpK
MPDHDDPFFDPDDDRTIIKPTPGGRAPGAPAPRDRKPQEATGRKVDISDRPGLNPLEKSAAVLLNLLSQIRNTSSHPNPSALHKQLASEINSFERNAQQQGIKPETIYVARYALCSTIDEFVMSTPWGASSIWSQQTLLSLFHKETRGGEKFFRLLEKLKQDPATNIDLLELLYLCLALGFQGRYRVSANGINELEEIRESLYYTIRNQRDETEPELSPHWQGLDKGGSGQKWLVPMWLATGIVVLLLVGLFSAWRFSLGGYADPVHARVVTLARGDGLLPTRVLATAPAMVIEDQGADRFGLAEFLRPEIQRGLVSVEELNDRIVVRISGDGLFQSGSEVVKSEYQDILERVGEGLAQTNGRIRIIGHTDSQPLRRGHRFSSNFELSNARAESVRRMLGVHVNNRNRMVAEGLGDAQPVTTDPARQSENRRVEIILMERARGS